jgi:hypothetical protein
LGSADPVGNRRVGLFIGLQKLWVSANLWELFWEQNMRRFGFCLLSITLLCLGCQQPQHGSVKIYRTNGEVTRVDLENNGSTTQIKSREEADAMIAHYEGLIAQLKEARDQFKVKEPAAPPQK